MGKRNGAKSSKCWDTDRSPAAVGVRMCNMELGQSGGVPLGDGGGTLWPQHRHPHHYNQCKTCLFAIILGHTNLPFLDQLNDFLNFYMNVFFCNTICFSCCLSAIAIVWLNTLAPANCYLIWESSHHEIE